MVPKGGSGRSNGAGTDASQGTQNDRPLDGTSWLDQERTRRSGKRGRSPKPPDGGKAGKGGRCHSAHTTPAKSGAGHTRGSCPGRWVVAGQRTRQEKQKEWQGARHWSAGLSGGCSRRGARIHRRIATIGAGRIPREGVCRLAPRQEERRERSGQGFRQCSH